MSVSLTSDKRKILLLASPALAIGLVFFQFVYGPLSQQIQVNGSRLSKLETMASRVDYATDSQQLADLRQEIKTLTEFLESNSDARGRFVKSQSDPSSTTGGKGSPASTIARLLSILERNKLTCVDSQLGQTPSLPNAEPPVATPQTAVASKSQLLDHNYALTFHGSLLDLQAAMQDLQEDSPDLDIVSIELVPIEGQLISAGRTWILKVRF